MNDLQQFLDSSLERDRTVWVGCRRSDWSSWDCGSRTVGAESAPDDVPSDTKNVPTFYRPGSGLASAVNHVDDAFASRRFYERVSVRVLNGVEEWGPSDHCRLMIEVKAKGQI